MRGIVSSWTDACPLEGACSECGLAFRWRDVLHPAYGIASWCVEARRSPGAWPAQLAGTFLRAARPRRFWSVVALHQPISWPRLLALVLSLAVTTLVLLDLATAAIVVADHRDVQTRGATSTATDAGVFLKVAGNPFSASPVAGYVYPLARGGTRTVVGLATRDYWRGLWLARWPVIVGVLITPLTTAIAFAVLPVARRRARVQLQHIGRVASYGFVVSFAALLVAAAGSTWSALRQPPIVRLHVLHVVAVLFLGVGTLTWWYAAVRSYLRMERSLAVAASATSIGLMIPVAAGRVADPIVLGETLPAHGRPVPSRRIGRDRGRGVVVPALAQSQPMARDAGRHRG
jgi:hypothetical protein